MRLTPREPRSDPAFRGRGRVARSGVLGWAVGLGLAVATFAETEPAPSLPPPSPETPPPATAEDSNWTGGLSLRTWAGYSDNPQLSSLNPQGSAFVAGGGDFTLLRLSDEGDLLTFLLSVERTAYLSRGINPETMALAELEFDEGLGGDWTLGGTMDYLYLNQVFDASELVGVPVIIPAEGHQVSVRPKLDRDLTEHWRARVEVEWARQWFAEPLDGFQDWAPKASMLWSDVDGTEAGISYGYRWREFEERPARAEDGTSMADTLQYRQHEVEAFAERKWGHSGRWRAHLRGGYRFNGDNGGGFYDYDRYHANAGLRCRGRRWELRGDVRWRWYQYPVQLAGVAGSPNRRRMEMAASARGEWNLRTGVRLFVQYAYERSDENVVAADYQVNAVSAGIELEM